MKVIMALLIIVLSQIESIKLRKNLSQMSSDLKGELIFLIPHVKNLNKRNTKIDKSKKDFFSNFHDLKGKEEEQYWKISNQYENAMTKISQEWNRFVDEINKVGKEEYFKNPTEEKKKKLNDLKEKINKLNDISINRSNIVNDINNKYVQFLSSYASENKNINLKEINFNEEIKELNH